MTDEKVTVANGPSGREACGVLGRPNGKTARAHARKVLSPTARKAATKARKAKEKAAK